MVFHDDVFLFRLGFSDLSSRGCCTYILGEFRFGGWAGVWTVVKILSILI